MKKYLFLCLTGVIFVGSASVSNAEPLRKCNFYEIMNDEDEDGLVQDPKDGPSVCQYTQQDLAAAKEQPTGRGGTIRAATSETLTTPEPKAVAPATETRTK